MFQDPLVAVMAMLILSFLGLMVMFIFVIRSLSSLSEEMRESFRKQQLFLSDLERQLLEVSFSLRGLSGTKEGQTDEQADEERDLPILRRKDSLLNMLEQASSGREDMLSPEQRNLLPQPASSRPLSEEYDPSTDPHLFEDSFLGDVTIGRNHANEAGRRDPRNQSGAQRQRVPSYAGPLDS